MSKYTTELRYIIEEQYNIGLDKYPIWNENYRQVLNDKIISHFRFREIAFETAALFVDRLNNLMGEIMPFYNQLYKTTELEINPFITYNIDEESKTTGETSSESKGETSTGQHALFSDTPQVQLSGNQDYATNLNQSKTVAENSGTGKDNTLSEYVRKVKGKTDSRSYPELLMIYRDSFINIDMMVIDELEVLFFGLW